MTGWGKEFPNVDLAWCHCIPQHWLLQFACLFNFKVISNRCDLLGTGSAALWRGGQKSHIIKARYFFPKSQNGSVHNSHAMKNLLLLHGPWLNGTQGKIELISFLSIMSTGSILLLRAATSQHPQWQYHSLGRKIIQDKLDGWYFCFFPIAVLVRQFIKLTDRNNMQTSQHITRH